MPTIGFSGFHSTMGEGALLSYRDFKVMRGRGLDPMAVYHYGERLYHLERYLHEEGVSYIGLGGVASFAIGRLADSIGLADALWTIPPAVLLGAGLCALLPAPDPPEELFLQPPPLVLGLGGRRL
jgi:hypothetical protein